MSGEKGLKTANPAKEELEKWDKILDEYECSTGLPAFTNRYTNDDAKSFLSMDRRQI